MRGVFAGSLVFMALMHLGPTVALAQTVLTPRLTLADPAIRDQDDMCFWIHPTDPALSTIVTSDKDANRLFVYDLQGATLQVLPVVGEAANIDIRYNLSLAGTLVDLVAINDRVERRLKVYRVDPITRLLERVDTGAIQTGENYGVCMYRSPVTGLLYAFATSQGGTIEQYELHEQSGQIAGTLVRSWNLSGRTEGCVCDDETGSAYFGEERIGIWKLGAEPQDPTTPALIAAVGDPSGLTADVEGLTIYYAAEGGGYLIASSQGSNEFKVYDRRSPHAYLRTFAINNVAGTDGIDVSNLSLGPTFPSGAFAAHQHIEGASKPVQVCGFEDVGLPIDTQYWNPRQAGTFPLILSFAPASGPTGTEVTITGVRFTGATSVSFNGVVATGFVVDTDTQVRAVVPDGTSTGPIRITTVQGTGTSSSAFGVPESPTVVAFAPASGPIGTAIEVTGTGLFTATSVMLGDVLAEFDVLSDTRLRATVPAGATSGPIRVVNPAGQSLSGTSFIVTAAPSQVTLGPVYDARVQSDAPTTNYGTGTGTKILLRVRSTGPSIASYLKFHVSGVSGPVAGAKLRLYCIDDSPDGGRIYSVSNDYAGTSTPWIETGLIWNNAPALAGPILAQKGAVPANTWVEFDVTPAISGDGVYSFGLTSNSTNIAGYSSKESAQPPQLVIDVQTEPPPQIASFHPVSGPVGTEVTVLGTQFESVSAVDFNGASTSFEIDSDTQLRAIVPAGATTGPVRVTGPGGPGTSALFFTVIGSPVLQSFSPPSGPVGTEVTLTGSELGAIQSVEFNGVAAFFEIESDTQLSATVPIGATTGRIRLTNAAGQTESATDFAVGGPAITGFLPTSGIVGTEVTFTGLGFESVTAVAFNGTPASFVIDSDTGLRATVPAGATRGPIQMTNADGTGTSPTDFLVIVSPSLTDFSPTRGLEGAEIVITGLELGATTAVAFNGTAADFTIDSDTRVRATVPVGVSTGPISVTNPAGTASSTTDFTITHTLGISVVDSGTVSKDPDQATYDQGVTVRLTAVPALGRHFVEWGGDASGSESPLALVMSGNRSVTAIFAVNTYSLDVTSIGSGAVSKSPDAISYDHGSLVTLTATPETGWAFVGWSGDAAGTTSPVSVLMDGNRSVTATFEQDPPPAELRFTAVHDARVQSDAPTTNYGTGTGPKVLLRVRNTGPAIRSYLKFDVAGVTGQVVTAKLRLFCIDDSPDGGRVYWVSNTYEGSATPWVESGLIWNNAPALAGSILDQKGAVPANTWVEFNVTPAITGSGTYSFGLSSNSGNIAGYNSKESTQRPELVLEFQSSTLPAILSFTPTGGPIGTVVTITGVRFTGATSVTFGGVEAENVVVDSDAQIRATVPFGATTGPIVVVCPPGNAISSSDFEVTVPSTVLTLSPTDDARVVSNSANSNYGSVTPLRARGTNPINQSFLKFNVTGLNGEVVSAKLRLYCVDDSPIGGRVYAVSSDYRGTATPWLEGGITYNNAPTISGTPLDQKGAVSANTWVEFDVTSAIASNGVHSFGLTSTSSNIVGYNSKEAATQRPELVIEWNAGAVLVLPVPATVAPAQVALHPNRPNPFTSQTRIRFELPRSSPVRLIVYDVQGRVVRTLLDEEATAGVHEVAWDGRDQAGIPANSGVYLLRMEAREFRSTRKLLLAR